MGVKGPYHLLGIGGIGMSALARILLDKQEVVSGSDAKKTPLLASLKQEGALLDKPGKGTYVVSSAIPQDHPELKEAKEKGYPILHRSELLEELARPFKTLAVAGTHGKTTTASLLAHVLMESNLDPAFAIGGILPTLNRNGRLGKGEYFVLEADESDGSLLRCNPYGAIVTGVEKEHLDYWKNIDALQEAFDRFSASVEELLFWCGDDPYLSSQGLPGTSYGFGKGCQLRASNILQNGFSTTFTAHFGDEDYSILLPLTGRHNVKNALAVFGLALKLQMAPDAILSALASFPGVARRCQITPVARGVLIIDDYAHHPTEVKTTLAGLKSAVQERRLIALFQPHRYTRLKECWEDFLEAFSEASEVWVTDVHPAGEAPIEGITASAFVKALEKKIPILVTYVPHADLINKAKSDLRPTDVLVGMGAGSITDYINHIGKALQENPVKKRTIGVVCGGPSCEHVISITSGKAVAAAIPREHYKVRSFVITRSGQWQKGFDDPSTGALPLEKLQECDLLIPVFHGPSGEDGQFAAFSETLGIPYVGCDPLSGALCMHKPKTKRIVQSEGIPTAPFVHFTKTEWEQDEEECIRQTDLFTYPLFVKTASSGSSLGVYRVEREVELCDALTACFTLDDDVLVEQGIRGRELEFAVLGNETIEVPPPGELITHGKMYTYEAKYEKPFETDPRPDLPSDVLEKGRCLAMRVYKALGCQGLSRVDFFLDEANQWWFNEINPFPGFTPISLYPKVWEASGLAFPDLIERLINLGFAKKRRRDALRKGLQWIAP